MSEHIRWNDKGQPLSTQFDDFYFSSDNGLEETQYVFLQQNQLSERFSTLANHASFVIAETGFGTGLNFLATCALWAGVANEEAHLHFISVEKFPLDKANLRRALNLWPELSDYSHALLDAYPATVSGFHRLHLQHNITLTLIIDDATIGLKQLLANPSTLPLPPLLSRHWQGVDAWFLDGFSPAKNPDMWTPDLFTTMAKLSKKEATVATFTAASKVRRGLREAGFLVSTVTGYGIKRHMAIASYQTNVSITDDGVKAAKHTYTPAPSKKVKQATAPWAIIDEHTPTPSNQAIAIIGGGIAACHTAYALAQKGYQITLFEKGDSLATGASGNAQGIVYAKLSASQEPLGDFNLYSLLYAQQRYQHYWASTADVSSSGAQCGVLQLSLSSTLQQSHQKIAQRFTSRPDKIEYLSATQASHTANTRIDYPALFFPSSGWIHPSHLCQWLTTHPNITVTTHTEITSVNSIDQQWRLSKTTHALHKSEAIFHTVVIANAYDAARITQTSQLPIKTVRGQVTHYPANKASLALTTAVCGKAYIAPAGTTHCLGASFNLGIKDSSLNLDDHRHNLQNVAQQVPDIIDKQALTSEDNIEEISGLSGRVGFRCVTPDYLPIVGGVPVTEDIKQQYQALQKDASTAIHQAGSYHPNLYINIGHGSRGLAYTPLCSEMLASLIHGDPPPIPQALCQKLNPARFIIRAIIRS
ncbi:MAG: tRNA 5-methylaminomethyl-2-thiouridine biosynthesis bifunctional protein [Candidatus Endobugula sp.]|jgi:tRNA 5-methylaminomethyl-2-thiouridine biosynthesis bifunctional protein